MPNTLTISSLAENIFRARDIVAREPTGFVQSIVVNSDSSGVSINGTVTSHRTAQPTLNTSYTPAMTPPDGDDQTVTVDTVTIGQVANVRIPLKGEDVRKLDNTAGQKVIDDMFAQAIRKIVNAIEAHCGTVMKNGASRATGTAGTTPFASNHNIIADAHQILIDNGTPMSDGDLSIVINTTAATKLRQLSNLYKANEAGSDALLRRGELMNLLGFSIKPSAGVASHTKGTGASYLINGGNVAIGSTTLTLDTGSGTILPGDIITYAADTLNKYVVKTALASNQVVIAEPGLQIATVDNNAVTVGNNYVGNVAFHRLAAELVMRPPAQPYGGDAAVDRMTITDEVTGLVFEVAIYAGYGMNMIDITTFYQAKVWKPEFVATILG